ncbi:hypothetical protein [Leifsonia sp. Root112D2]|uniref:hypothetical protein n=1 Tax=Leifsonia sp. Root112D2 TaxID=1736426 RepID=UPI0006F78A7D|nr:hypothetical protein [Leifsonia sp. Root112D2]KQV06130.1 hypothetical protein ASC63_01170 [Leifsonia sp. Root112D2]
MSSDSNDELADPSPERASRYTIVGATAINAVFVLSVQLLGLVALAPVEFGFFSIQYLFFALASSVCLSVVCEPWLRTDLHEKHRSSWRDYSSALFYLSLLAGIVTAIVSIAIVDLRVVAATGAVAVIAATYRSGARYHEVRMGRWRRVLRADTAGLVVTVAVWAVLYGLGERGLLGLSLAWAVGALVSAVLSPLPFPQRPLSIRTWVATHKRQIAPLLRDSTLMDLGAIGTPFAVAPLMGIANFGVYRAVSNVAAPVRLVLNPLRPTLAGAPLTTHRHAKRVWASAVVSVAFGLAAYGALLVIGSTGLNLGSLSAVVTYAAPTALFVTANFLGHYYYIIARTHMRGGPLLVGRVVQTVLAIVFPLAGAAFFGLSVAIWAYAIATLTSGLTWFILVARPARR